MKRLKTTDISTSVALPIKSGTLEFLQDAHQETIKALMTVFVENPITDTVYILSGCVNSALLPIHNISSGYIYLNGEIYQFDGASFTLTGLQKAYGRIETTQFLTNADPVTFTDGVPRNIHNIRKLVIENTITSSGVAEFKDFVLAGKYFKGETKNLVMTSTEYANKFVTTGITSGLGLKEFTGWAEMNGNNGTINDDGKVEVAFGTSRPTLGATFGNNTVTLTRANLPSSVVIPLKVANGSSPDGGALAVNFDLNSNDPLGSDTAFDISQPSIVRLRIQKI